MLARSTARLCTLLLGGGLLGVSLAGCPTDPVPVDAPMTDAPGSDTRVDTGRTDTGGTDGGGTDSGTDTGGGPVCGDGNVEGDEACDDENTSTNDGCDASCEVEDGFTCDAGEPSTCTATCGDSMVVGDEECDDNDVDDDGCTECQVDDGWVCPTGKACREIVCGDGNTDGGEMCDDGNTDVETGCDYGTASCEGCNADCSAVLEELTGNVCGDTVVDADNETCDPPAAGTCSDTCQTLAVCGNGLVEGGEECDDSDTVEGDGCSDVCETEAGFTCTGEPSECSLTEIEPNEDGTPAVGGSTTTGNDFDAMARMTADTNFAMLPLNASAGEILVFGAIGVLGDEDVFAVQNDGTDPVALTAGTWRRATGFGIGVACGDGSAPSDTVVRVYDDAGTSVALNDDRVSGADVCSEVTYVIPAGERVYVHIMEYGDNAAEPAYILQLQMAPVVCGDGVRNGAEVCDDGDTDTGDGCDDVCEIETGFVCPTPGDDCREIACGDGFRDSPEVCDDGDLTGGDGCSATCTVEAGYLCDGASPSMCIGPASNGTCASATAVTANASFPILNYTTGGPRPTGTGCGFGTGLTTLYYLVTIPATTAVVVTTTGGLDRVLMTQDACADLGCTSQTDAEPETATLLNETAAAITRVVAVRPYNTGSSGTLGIAFAYSAIVCGDGLRVGAEACDDGGTAAGDGCSATCTVEANYTCTGDEPSVCVPNCGNGTINAGEACDDGNTANDDGCSSTCTVESDTIVTGTGTPVAIPDNTPAGVTSTATVATSCTVAAVELTVAVTHAWTGDVGITLTAPGGAPIQIIPNAGTGSSNDLLGPYVFAATGGGNTAWPGSGNPVAAGRYLRSTMTGFAGATAAGTWTLAVVDDASGDLGTLESWSLAVRCAP